MQDLLHNPAVQAGVLPFTAALAAAAALRKTRLLGLAIGAAFICAVALTMGFGFDSLTALRKLVLAGIAAVFVGVACAFADRQPRTIDRAVVAAMAGAATLWMLQRVLQQREALELALGAAAAVTYSLTLLAAGERCTRDPVCAGAATLVLALATGALGLLGASAQLAQLGIALGAGAGAVVLLQMLRATPVPAGSSLVLPAQFIAGLIGLLAVWTGSLPWYCLLPLPLVTWVAQMAPATARPPWQRAVLCVLFALIPALLAVGLAWFTAGDSPALFPVPSFFNPEEIS